MGLPSSAVATTSLRWSTLGWSPKLGVALDPNVCVGALAVAICVPAACWRTAEGPLSHAASRAAAAAAFGTPRSLAARPEARAHSELFALTAGPERGQTALPRSTGLVVPAPATAALMAKAADGLANDRASTALRGTDKPVLMAP